MQVNPLISILTPTYNHQDYIARCLDSIIQQTYANWEQIIIDDGSRDNTEKIVSAYRDPRIRYERQSNQGPFGLAKTYNRALSMAKGDLIAILEGDDLWPPDKLATLVPAFQDNSVVLAYGKRVDIDARGRRQRRKTRTARSLENLPLSILSNDPVGTATRYMLRQEGRSLVHPCTVVIRRSSLEGIGGFQYVPGLPQTDYPTFLELSLVGKFCFVCRPLGYLRRHQNSITVNHAWRIHEAVSALADEFVKRHSHRLALSPSDLGMIKDGWREAEDRLHFSEGRMLLLQKKWSEARIHFRAASRSKSARVCAAGLTGLLLSLARMNMEPLMRLGGSSDLRPRASNSVHAGVR